MYHSDIFSLSSRYSSCIDARIDFTAISDIALSARINSIDLILSLHFVQANSLFHRKMPAEEREIGAARAYSGARSNIN
jgi:hypothetical protein